VTDLAIGVYQIEREVFVVENDVTAPTHATPVRIIGQEDDIVTGFLMDTSDRFNEGVGLQGFGAIWVGSEAAVRTPLLIAAAVG
jgi:hypothetical protein